ncbi:MAG: endonuclease III [Deltaproteobacteria bacterium]|nr:MAG: endonuclease III [Deltaproteobacteria bacterium]
MGGHHKSQSAPAAVDERRVRAILDALERTWGHATCELNHRNPFELLVATILSAQSTDKRVNQVTPELFARYPTPAALAAADPDDVERIVHSTGFFRQKTRAILGVARALVDRHGGEVPRSMEALTALPGVARKTANVVLGTAFGIPSGIVVDTHVKRLANRLGLTRETDPVKIERDLMALIPRDRWIDFSHQLIWHGRRICHARKPACDQCPLAPHCPSAEVGA